MLRIVRIDLPRATQKALEGRQEKVNEQRAAGTLNTEKVWKGARQTKSLKTALSTLKTMAGSGALHVLRRFTRHGHRAFLAENALSRTDVSLAQPLALLYRMRSIQGGRFPPTMVQQ